MSAVDYLREMLAEQQKMLDLYNRERDNGYRGKVHREARERYQGRVGALHAAINALQTTKPER